ncbi:MAG: hypothetical protein ATN33_08270 [Epulopiscium sp. Nele67-Bin001]|nr:MAG: hypothetical protein ATN33_08270 [Epulopiscium sp. Nele67-Bin001]
MKKFSKHFALFTAAVAFSGLVGCSSNSTTSGTSDISEISSAEASNAETSYTPTGTAVIAISSLNGVFSPFFYTTGYDSTIVSSVHEYLLINNRDGQLESRLAEYNVEEITNEAGELQTVYTFTLLEGLLFSDGEAVTADDIIFSYKVVLDPTFDGISTLRTVDIIGLDDYIYGDATEIEGIQKIDDRTVQITINGIDPAAIYKLAIAVTPEHYYGEGFVKGDLSTVKEKNSTPMGAGPYKFVSFENNVVNLIYNENYFLGTPKTEKLKYQVTDTSNFLEAVITEQVDISNPTASPEMLARVEDAKLHYELVEWLGYGYIGINADRIPDINVRKGLMHLMNREPAINSYYGDLGEVIERPMTTLSWAYPQDAEEYYGYDTAKALEYFTLAGYEQIDGKLVKDGVQFHIEVGISGSGTMDHPAAPILTQMKTDIESMGGVLEIFDTDSTVFFEVLRAEEWDMWTASWTQSADPDMYQLYHSDGSSTYYNINNEELDEIIVAARSTNDTDLRIELYHEALDIVMEQAVEMPIYQRKNMYVINPDYINIDSLPEDMTPFYTFYKELYNIEMVK